MSKKKLYTVRDKIQKKGRVREACDFFPVTEFFAGSGLVTEALKDTGAFSSVDNRNETDT